MLQRPIETATVSSLAVGEELAVGGVEVVCSLMRYPKLAHQAMLLPNHRAVEMTVW